MKLTTSLGLCRAAAACDDQYILLARALGADWGDDQPIPLTMLLDIEAGPEWTAFDNTLWALRAVPAEQTEARDRLAAAFSAQLLGFVLGASEYWVACRKLRAYSRGEASREEVQQVARAAWDSWIGRPAVTGAWTAKCIWAAIAYWAVWATARAARSTGYIWGGRATRDISLLRWLLDEEKAADDNGALYDVTTALQAYRATWAAWETWVTKPVCPAPVAKGTILYWPSRRAMKG